MYTMPQKNKKIPRSIPLVAIDLGSSAVRAMAAKRTEEGSLDILGYEEINERPECIDRGVITKSSDAGHMISKILKLLANRIGVQELGSVFVARGGRSMQVVAVSSFREFGRKSEITTSLLNELANECYTKIDSSNQNARVVGLVPIGYVLDGKPQYADPTTLQARRIEVQYSAFVMMKDYVDSFDKSFQQAFKVIESSFLRPEALLSAIARHENSDIYTQGVALLDLGAQTTTLTIYQGSRYYVNKVVPLGSEHITRLIAQQGVAWNTAEQLKTQFGFASPSQVEQNRKMRIPALQEGQTLTMTTVELSEIIESKLKEIFTNIFPLLQRYAANYRVVYISGGGAMLSGLIPWLQSQIVAEVRGGDHYGVMTRRSPDEYCSPRYTSLVGALLLAADWRDNHPCESKSIFQKFNDFFGSTIIDLFNDENG